MLHLPKGGHIRVGPHRQRQKDVASIETTICLIAQICVKLFQLSSHQHLQSASIRSNCRPGRNRFATFALEGLESFIESGRSGCSVVTCHGGQIAKIHNFVYARFRNTAPFRRPRAARLRHPRSKGKCVVCVLLASITDFIQRLFICHSSYSSAQLPFFLVPPLNMRGVSGTNLTRENKFLSVFQSDWSEYGTERPIPVNSCF